MANWKTTIGGLLMAIGTALVSSGSNTMQSIGYICLGLGGLITGLAASDASKS